jgi:hypothetical protein
MRKNRHDLHIVIVGFVELNRILQGGAHLRLILMAQTPTGITSRLFFLQHHLRLFFL